MSDPARIIDANANRAREGLRLLEELARFQLDDPNLTEQFKSLRHALAEALSLLPISALDRLNARDTPGDVGTSISTAAERERRSVDSLAAAAAARSSEALRVLEETSKLLASSGTRFETLRYRLYELERTLRLRLHSRLPQWRLCVLITESICVRPWLQVAQAAIAGGADCIQLREKHLPDHELLARARTLVELVDHRAHVVINDRPDIALLAGADAVHLGQNDLPVRAVCRFARSRIAVGCSAHSLEQAQSAVRDGASYLGLGAMFPTSTKPDPSIVGCGLIRQVLACETTASVPHLAIGGITPENAGELVEAGARGLAVSSAVCSDPDPERICRTLRAYYPARTTPTSACVADDPDAPCPSTPPGRTPRGDSTQ